MTTTSTTIEAAAENIVALDREAIAMGEEVGDIGAYLRLLPRMGYELSTDQLAAAFRRAAELQIEEADALEREAD
jgi:hypothetical protein